MSSQQQEPDGMRLEDAAESSGGGTPRKRAPSPTLIRLDEHPADAAVAGRDKDAPEDPSSRSKVHFADDPGRSLRTSSPTLIRPDHLEEEEEEDRKVPVSLRDAPQQDPHQERSSNNQHRHLRQGDDDVALPHYEVVDLDNTILSTAESVKDGSFLGAAGSFASAHTRTSKDHEDDNTNKSSNFVSSSLRSHGSGPSFKDQARSVDPAGFDRGAEELGGPVAVARRQQAENSSLRRHGNGPSYKDQVRLVDPAGFDGDAEELGGPVAVAQRKQAENSNPFLPNLNEKKARSLKSKKGFDGDDVSVTEEPMNVGADGDDETPIVNVDLVGGSAIAADPNGAELGLHSSSTEARVYQADAYAFTGGFFVKRRWMVALIALVIVVAAVVGGVCGSGYCSSGGSTSTKIIQQQTPTAAPTTFAPTTMEPSSEPSSMPSIDDRSNSIVLFINSVSLSGTFARYPVSSDTATPEEKALEWLIQDDPLQLSTDTDQIRLTQRFALLTLWYSLNGESWLAKDGWLESEDECSWSGIACNDNKQVITIGADEALQQNNLSGSIPADISLLQATLAEINLSANLKLMGTLPPALGNLTLLKTFDVNTCGLSGSLPESIGAGWSRLTSLAISDNNFEGILLPSMGAWTDLSSISIKQNQFSGTLSETFSAWSKLDYVYLDDNRFSGTISPSFETWNPLQFDISTNNFSGSLPESLGSWNRLQFILLDDNTFTGELPSSIGRWNGLLGFSIGENEFSGTLPEGIGAWTNINNFLVRNCKLSGTIPDSLGQWSNIYGFDVTGNEFSSTLPSVIGNWTNIEVFSMSFNNFTGTLPDEALGRWSRLKQFWARDNELTGTLPDVFSQWPDLGYFAVSENSIQGTLPESIGQCTSLMWFYVFENQLTGSLPTTIGQWTALTEFLIYDNAFTSTLPDTISQWSDLTSFETEFNLFSGTLPDTIGSSWTNLEVFSVYDNLLEGFLSSSLGLWSSIIIVWLEDNQFGSTLPEAIGEWVSLGSFDISRNEFTGSLPETIGRWTNLLYFDINENNLTGSIPESVSQWRNLQVAFFNDTNLVGAVPDGLCDAMNLTDLVADCVAEVQCSCCTDCY